MLRRFGTGEGDQSNCSMPRPFRYPIQRKIYGCLAVQVASHGEKGNCGISTDSQSGAPDNGPPSAVGVGAGQGFELYQRPAVDMGFSCRLRQYMTQAANRLAGTWLKSISRWVLPKRSGRIEPRTKKRRPKPLPLLTVARSVAREQIRAQLA